MTPTYKTATHAAQAFVRAGRRAGTVLVLGGGWWQLAGRWRAVAYGLPVHRTVWRGAPAVKVQGLDVLADLLEKNGQLVRRPDGRAELVATSDECPKCSRIGAGPLCTLHRPADQARQAEPAAETLTQPCRHGHGSCSDRQGGPCSDERATLAEAGAQRPQRPAAPTARRCAWCGQPGGPSHAVQVGGQMRAFYLHRRCLRPFIAAKGDR